MNGKMRPEYRILYIASLKPGNPLGGAELSFLQILRIDEWERNRCSVVVSEDGEFSEICAEIVGEVFHLPMLLPPSSEQRKFISLLRFFLNVCWNSLRLARLVVVGKYDLLCSINRGGHSYASLAGKLVNRPVIIHLRDIPQSRYMKRIYRNMINLFVNKLIIFSDSVLKSIEPISTVINKLPMGIDLELFQDSPSQNATIGENFPVLCTAGRISASKGLIELVQALKIVTEYFPNVELRISGKSWNDDEGFTKVLHQEICDRNLNEHIHFLGQLSMAQMPAFYSSADIVVVSSYFESFGRTVIEGMAIGKPVVSTRCGGPEEIISDGIDGILVDVGDVEALAEAIINLSKNDKLRKEMGKAGRLKVQQEYDVRNYVSSVLEAHDELFI
jgi:glycosyltransferase involved in cell wall biosynthesis